MNLIKKLGLSCITAGLALSLCSVAVLAEEDNSGNKEFDELLQQDFIDTMESDYLTMHFTVKDYKAMGLEKPEPVVGKSIEQSMKDSKEEADKMIAKLKEFDYDSLSESQQHDYDAILFAYEDQRDRASDENYSWFFTPSNNLITNLSTNFTEFVFYEAEDFEDYLSVLKSVPAYLEEAVEFTKKQSDKGYFMSDAALDETLSQISDFTSKQEDNPLIADFDEDCSASELIDDAKKEEYKQENKDLILNELLPACDKVAEELETMRGTGGQTGYYYMDGGLDYYTKEIQNTASTNRSIQEQFKDLDQYLQDNMDEYFALMRSDENAGYGSVEMDEPNQDLEFLTKAISEYGFPEFPDVNYTAVYLDPSIVPGNVVAYYMSSPVDDFVENSIKINPNGVSDATELYYTLAHEGVPGHMYQHVYYLSQNPNYIRTICSFLGYTEGWAMYAEVNALDFDVLSNNDAQANILLTKLNYSLWSIADLGVNGMGWDEKDLADYLEGVGLNSSIAGSLYQNTLIYPAVYNSYGYGLCRLDRMRQYAEESLGTAFDAEEFNEVILDNGPRLLDAVQTDVEAYVDGKGGTNQKPVYEPTENNTGNIVVIIGGVAIVAGVVLLVLMRARKKKDPLI